MRSLIELEPAVWSEKQFGTCDLGDVRRTQRLVRYAQQMAEKPDASTPRQTEDWADCKAVYRLFQRPEVTFESVTAAHYQNTRTLPLGRYLVISDTTEIDFRRIRSSVFERRQLGHPRGSTETQASHCRWDSAETG